MKRRALKAAFPRTVPVMTGYLFLGAAYGMYLRASGFSFWYPLLMSVTIFGGSLEFLAVSLLLAPFAPLATFFMALLIQARHLFYSLSMLEKYQPAGACKPYLIFALTDETYSLLCDKKAPPGDDPDRYRFYVSFFNQCYWVLGSVIGSLLGAVIPFSTEGIEFSMTALFIASFTEQWLSTKDHVPALTGLLATLLCLVLFGADRFLIPAMLLITLVLTLLRKREEALL